MHIPAQPWRSPRLCESLISRGIFFLAKPQRALRHAYPQRSLGVLRAFARDLLLARIYFLDKPLWALRHAHPCAAFAFSATLREPHFPRDIFLAKPQRALRHAYPCGALASNAPSAGKGFMPFPALTPTTQKTCRTGITLFPRLFSIRQCIVSPLRS